MTKRTVLFGGLILLIIIVVGVLYLYIFWLGPPPPSKLVLIVADEDDIGNTPVLNITLMDLTDYPTLQEALDQMLTLEPLPPQTRVSLPIQEEESYLINNQLLVRDEGENIDYYRFIAYQQYFFEINFLV